MIDFSNPTNIMITAATVFAISIAIASIAVFLIPEQKP